MVSPHSIRRHRYSKKDERQAWLLVPIGLLVIFCCMLWPLSTKYSLYLMILPASFKHLHLSTDEAEKMARRHNFLFLGGPHRGGTTLFWRLLRVHPQLAAFDERTDSDFSEGAFLQSVLPTFGVGHERDDCMRKTKTQLQQSSGVSRYGLDPSAHLTEYSSLASTQSRDTLLSEWGYYWAPSGLEKPVLLEKTPTNMMTARLLQELFGSAGFLIITRHPLAVALAQLQITSCGRAASSFEELSTSVLHWTLTHTVLQRDLHRLSAVRVVRYEDLASAPSACLTAVGEWLRAPRDDGGLGAPISADANLEWIARAAAVRVDKRTNAKYEAAYCAGLRENEERRAEHCERMAALQPLIDELGLGYNVVSGGGLGFACAGEQVSCPKPTSTAREDERGDAARLRAKLTESLAAYREPIDPDSKGRTLGGTKHLLCAGLSSGELAR